MNPETTRLTRRRARRAADARRAALRSGKGRCSTTAKTRFPTWESGVAAALRLSAVLGRPIRTYLCGDCGGWHLTRLSTWKDTP